MQAREHILHVPAIRANFYGVRRGLDVCEKGTIFQHFECMRFVRA